MTLQIFEAQLKEACPDVYHLSAPPGLHRYAVWHSYGVSSCLGDDRNQLDIPKVQIDIVSQQYDDPMVDAIFGALWLMDIPYTVASAGYDPDYNAYRVILQMVVV